MLQKKRFYETSFKNKRTFKNKFSNFFLLIYGNLFFYFRI